MFLFLNVISALTCLILDFSSGLPLTWSLVVSITNFYAIDKIVSFCEKNSVHCFLVAHPTKIQKDKATGKFEIPNLYSISGSANFYNKAANGITVYRDYENFTTEVYIQKVKFKHWGQTGCCQLAWDKTNGRYYKGMPNYDNWIQTNKPKELQPNNDFISNPQDIITNNGNNEHEF